VSTRAQYMFRVACTLDISRFHVNFHIKISRLVAIWDVIDRYTLLTQDNMTSVLVSLVLNNIDRIFCYYKNSEDDIQ
jgi:hypothetical protein